MTTYAKHRRAFIIAAVLLGVLLACATMMVFQLTRPVADSSSEEKLEQQLKHLADNAYRPSVLLVGDSFLEVTWPFNRVLGIHLPEYLESRGVNAVLTAQAGFGPYGYLKLIEDVLPRVRPKLLILFLFAGNDVTDTMQDIHAFVPKSGPCVCNEKAVREGVFDWEMMKRCGVDTAVIDAARRRMSRPHAPGGQRINPNLICTAMEYPQFYRANLALDLPEARAAWQKIEALLRQLRDRLRQSGAELQLVMIPAALQVDPDYISFLRQMKFEVDDGLASEREPQRRLKAFCEQEKIGFLDLLPASLASPRRKQLYFQYDDHFRGEGHELAYGIVIKQLIDPWFAAQAGEQGENIDR